ncbi:MAG: Gfo/Idh/MocA family oxidoreductase [Clostridia bacterium]|nr:Gfo/Idh/MocA family oxidoreductase [Clostridia bacterium]
MKKFRSAVIGCGNIFPMHAVSITRCPNAQLVAVCDIKKDRADKKAAEFEVKAYYDYKEMLDKEDIDVVHICLPHYLHPIVAIECCKRGKHVLTEKPMSIELADARKMIDTAKECGVTLACIFQNRYNAGTMLVKKLLDNGTLGAVKSAKCFVTWDRSDAYYGASDWKGTWDKEGGGVIIDQAIHTLDAMRYLIGRPVESVDATIANRGHAKIDVEDTAEGVIRFDNGVLANFHAINYYGYDADVYIELYCENGIAKLTSDVGDIKLFDGRTFHADRPNENFGYGNVKSYWGVNHCKQINNFYECLSTGEEMFIPVESAYETMEMVCAIYESGKKKQRIFLHK